MDNKGTGLNETRGEIKEKKKITGSDIANLRLFLSILPEDGSPFLSAGPRVIPFNPSSSPDSHSQLEVDFPGISSAAHPPVVTTSEVVEKTEKKLQDRETMQVINHIADDVHETALDKGWWNDARSDGEVIVLIHSELSEWVEGLRDGTATEPDDHCPDFTNGEIEAADVIIRVLDLAASKNYRIGEAMLTKIAFNETRPYRHGKKW